MKKNEVHCAHACRNTCAMLIEALEREQVLSDFYGAVSAECDYPDVQAALADVAALRKKTIGILRKQLDDMQARGEVLDSVKASFDPAGC